ncbi:BCCT family transporter [Larsenimonas rhizosphaerae]|uniref:BCCT family transporter n=1 Tax=Larsenimonas rhizosphaerae TaxID=2944682 RepID=A0AA41ZIA8_9GAMM|nr:BCCT family transporter [Larsenimonas rhizosphaerae]MCM2131383.1 BCCT family transporter [Larsenimonas rhizosphaerae]MCX2525252.1 BCCT family transporter [Larsenimonas rhizosphaerae]
MPHTPARDTGKPSGLFHGVDRTMAITSILMVIAFLLFTVLFPETANHSFSVAMSFIKQQMNWYYILVIAGMLFFTLTIAFSPMGRLRLGRDDERPEFGNFTWFAMLFSAAVGTGLLFWSIAEPLSHFQSNPFATMEGVEAGSRQAAEVALRITIFHWGLHGWAVYITVGMILGYFAYRRGLPLTIRSTLYPLIGDRIYGPIGHVVDLLAIFSTLFGTATTLGLGVSQMNAGLNSLFGMPISTTSKLMLIGAITLLATLSVCTGLKRGIKMISEWNIHLSMILVLFFLIAGPTTYLLGLFSTSIGSYLSHAIEMSFWVDPDPTDQWQGWWTLFYWGWWLSWGPYVGMFVARISRGRTVRSLILGGMGLATLGSLAWIVVFGGTALQAQLTGQVDLVSIVNQDKTQALFETIGSIGAPWVTTLMTGIATVMIITWFVTSADSGTLVICTILSMGDEQPRTLYRVIWGIGLGAVSAVLLLAGGLEALQTAAIMAAFPFSLVFLVMCFCVVKAMREETDAMELHYTGQRHTDVQERVHSR